MEVYSILDLDEGYFWRSASAQLILHERYNDDTITNDIALIRTQTSASFNGELILTPKRCL